MSRETPAEVLYSLALHRALPRELKSSDIAALRPDTLPL